MPEEEKEPVHATLYQVALCKFSPHTPDKWPEGNLWLDVREIKNINEITCARCRPEAEKIISRIAEARRPPQRAVSTKTESKTVSRR